MKGLKQFVETSPLPKLRTRYQRGAFAVELTKLLQEHKDPEVQKLAKMIQYLISAPKSVVEGMLSVELSESPRLKLLAIKVQDERK